MNLTEENALQIAYNLKKSLLKLPHKFEKADDQNFEYALTFFDKASGQKCEFLFGVAQSVVRDGIVKLDITSLVSEFLSKPNEL